MTMSKASTNADSDFGAQFLENRKRRRRRRIIGSLVVIGIVGGFYFWETRPTEEVASDQDLIVTIGYGDIENAIPAAGSLQPKEVVPVGARASGELVEIYVEVGDLVEEGQPLALIDPEEQKLRVENSELSLENQRNQIEQRENSLENAIRNYERTTMLREAEAATEQELENAFNSMLSAQTSLDNLRIQIKQSETSLQQEKVQLNYTEVKAPLSGTVIEITQKEGATLNASQTAPTVMQIADLRTMTVETEISEADISSLNEGIEVYFTTLGGGDRRWYGELRQIDPMPKNSNNVVLYNGRFDVDNSDGGLYPGMTTQVFFVTSSARNVLTVPLGALTYTDTPAGANGAMAGRQGGGRGQGEGAAGREELAARMEQFRQSGQIPPDMQARIDQFRQGGGNFDASGFGGRGGRGQAQGGEGGARLSGLITRVEPRNATVQVVQPDGTRVTREIVVGATDRVNAEVISGLAEGDRVLAGVIQARVEDEQDSNNRNNNNWNNRGGFPGGSGFRPF